MTKKPVYFTAKVKRNNYILVQNTPMENIDLLPKSKIITELENKSKSRVDIQLDYIDILANFKTKVCQEASYINQIFPEYTPHDEPHHLSRLFSLADDILGTTLIENLNSTELLILSLSLYGHDWGMAVSHEERNIISSTNEQSQDNDFILIANEKETFKRILNEQGVKEADSTLWQEYIRQTHANRSQERIIKYFSQINYGLGLAVGKVCLAHALDIEKLQDSHDYPVTHTVLHENINLRAIAVYVRLIDLLDITEFRTPYTIWKYVAPRNTRSKMEWKKHRAISSIKTVQYENIRSVIVAASTNDHSVYASLIDLKNYCNDQLKGCNGLLYNNNDPKYYLNIHEIRWNIDARGFKPISLQFEFDRVKMFEILSDEIYETDRHVFLRELIQNSIDAIQLRSKVLTNKGIPNEIEDIGKIEVDVIDTGEDIIEISICDNGIGMDEYIIRTYFSVAGKSYYKSEDFEKLGIKLDPISKFGIGVLSCFMVADSIEVITTRDPYITRNSTTLKLNIDSVSTQFKVQEMSNDNHQQGTRIRVFVSKSKLKSKVGNTSDSNMYVSEYLTIVAAFSEIPILISENNNKTLVINPYSNINKIKQKYPEYDIKTIQLSPKNTDIFSDHSKDGATNHFTQSTIDLNKDLGIQNVSGTITYTIPKCQIDLINNDNSWPAVSYTFKTENTNYRITLNTEYIRNGVVNDRSKKKLGESSKFDKRIKVYLKGILVNNTTIFRDIIDRDLHQVEVNILNSPFYISSLDIYFITPALTINLLGDANINVSRSSLINESSLTLNEEINNSLAKYLIDNTLNDTKSILDRTLKIIYLHIYHRIDIDQLLKYYDINNIPILYYNKENNVILKEWKNFINNEIYSQVDYTNLSDSDNIDLSSTILFKSNIPTNDFIICDLNAHDDELQGKNIKSLFSITKKLLLNTHLLHSIRFFGTDSNQITSQNKWIPKNINTDSIDDKLLEKVSNSEIIINTVNINQILSKLHTLFSESKISLSSFCCFVNFEMPYQNYFAYNRTYLNINHPYTIAIIRLMCIFALELQNKTLSQRAEDTIIDSIQAIPFLSFNNNSDLDNLNDSLNLIIDTLRINKISVDLEKFSITQNDFVPNSIEINDKKINYYFPREFNISEYKLLT